MAKQVEIAKAARVLERQIKRGKSLARTLGYQRDPEDHTVYWHHEAGV